MTQQPHLVFRFFIQIQIYLQQLLLMTSQTNYIDSTTSHVIAQAFVTSSADEMRSETNEEVEELELIEEVVEEPFDEQVFVDDVTTIRDDDGVSEKMSQLEELEIRLRERAIKSLKKARNSS